MSLGLGSFLSRLSSGKKEEKGGCFACQSKGKLGIIAGGGLAPKQLIDACKNNGRELFVICLKGQADGDVAADCNSVWLSLGEGARLKQVILEQQIKEIVMIGKVRRPSIAELKPDALALKVLTKAGISMIGDDALLTAVGKALEAETGAKVIGAHEVFADLLAPRGVITTSVPDEIALQDIERGRLVALEIGRLDVGQSVVVQQGIVLGVEAIEGTDALIERSSSIKREGVGGVLVKMSKPQQDCRFDLPTIGPDTVENAYKAGLRGIAVEAGCSLIVDRERVLKRANELGLFIVGIGGQK